MISYIFLHVLFTLSSLIIISRTQIQKTFVLNTFMRKTDVLNVVMEDVLLTTLLVVSQVHVIEKLSVMFFSGERSQKCCDALR